MFSDLFGIQDPDLTAWLIVSGLVAWIFLRGVFR